MEIGFKPMPWSLRIFSVLYALWVLMTIMVVFSMPDRIVYLFGFEASKMIGLLAVALIDIILPIVVLVQLYRRKAIAWKLGVGVNAFFIISNIVNLVVFSSVMGVMPILVPVLISTYFLLTLWFTRKYF